VVVAYGPAAPAAAALHAAIDALAAHGVAIHDALRVTDGRWHSHLCGDPRCCPPDGARYDPVGSPIAAEAVLAGQVALPDRPTLAPAAVGRLDTPRPAGPRRRPATLLAFAGRGGQGALANIAVDRALHADPEYSMALLLAKALATGVPRSALHDWPPRPKRATPTSRRPAPLPGPARHRAQLAWRRRNHHR
jgi:hypothetical protein